MKFTYAYKTSDGVRHEASMDAESREAVFAALRQQGIKAIKVVAADGSKANGEARGVRKRVLVASVIGAALLAGAMAFVAANRDAKGLASGVKAAKPLSRTEQTAFDELRRNAGGVKSRMEADYAALHAERLLDAVVISDTNQTQKLFRLVKDGDRIIGRARDEMQAMFKGVTEGAYFSAQFLQAVQLLYGELMAEIDVAAAAHSNRRYAFVLLDSNRGKWRVFNGKPAFADQQLFSLYQYCIEGVSTDASNLRWRKDFPRQEDIKLVPLSE